MPIRRRTILRWAVYLSGALRLPRLQAWAQTAGFPGDQTDALKALAHVVLPSELGATQIDRTADEFLTWVRGYRSGAEMDHGYGFTRLRSKGTSPAANYLKQLEALRTVLLSADLDAKREAVMAALEAAKVTDLPRNPDGRHIAADLMAFYFRSSAANDLCYRAAIGRDLCRGLEGSEKTPAPLKDQG